MPGQFDQALIDELLGGDPLLTRDEAAARLGLDVTQLDALARSGAIPSISPGTPPGGTVQPHARRFRTSAIDTYATQKENITP